MLLGRWCSVIASLTEANGETHRSVSSLWLFMGEENTDMRGDVHQISEEHLRQSFFFFSISMKDLLLLTKASIIYQDSCHELKYSAVCREMRTVT